MYVLNDPPPQIDPALIALLTQAEPATRGRRSSREISMLPILPHVRVRAR